MQSHTTDNFKITLTYVKAHSAYRNLTSQIGGTFLEVVLRLHNMNVTPVDMGEIVAEACEVIIRCRESHGHLVRTDCCASCRSPQ
jgi:hypothetical protein